MGCGMKVCELIKSWGFLCVVVNICLLLFLRGLVVFFFYRRVGIYGIVLRLYS